MRCDTRLEIKLPAESRRELHKLADEIGLSSADLVRLGIRYVLSHRDALLRPPMEQPQ